MRACCSASVSIQRTQTLHVNGSKWTIIIKIELSRAKSSRKCETLNRYEFVVSVPLNFAQIYLTLLPLDRSGGMNAVWVRTHSSNLVGILNGWWQSHWSWSRTTFCFLDSILFYYFLFRRIIRKLSQSWNVGRNVNWNGLQWTVLMIKQSSILSNYKMLFVMHSKKHLQSLHSLWFLWSSNSNINVACVEMGINTWNDALFCGHSDLFMNH